MEFVTVIIFLALVYNVAGWNSLSFAVKKDCTGIRIYKVKKEIPYEEFHYYGESATSGKLDIQKKFRTEEIELNRTIPICCNGYQAINEELCIPVCSKSCGSRSLCSAPEVCTCEEDYVFDPNLRNCKPNCYPECKTGSCIAPNVCSCEEGYKWSSPDWGSESCKPICDNCTSNEICVEPHVCQCKEGYTRQLMARPDNLDVSECKPVCDEECVNAECVGPNDCHCHDDYTKINQFTCDVRGYHISDFAIRKNCTETVVLKNRRLIGDDWNFQYIETVLENTTVSICCEGYQNLDSDLCIPICNKLCGPQGICSAPNVCTCDQGYEMDNDLHECKPVCERGCLNGRCIGPNMCACNDEYRKVLDFACAPICTQDCFMGICTAPDTCTCRKGFQLSPTNKFVCELTRPKH